jgi:pimeloyl-ACP methyl ester carboxylesterase
VVERGLATPDALTCPGYLVWNNAPVRDVFLVINGSGTGSSAFVHPTFEGLLSHRPVAYSTYDKPGVSAPFGDPAAVRRDYATLERYTLGHGIACATEALRWARQQFGPSVRLHLRGHSEGALVALYLYDALLDGDPDTAARIATLVLSGLALQPIAELVEGQLAWLPDGARLRQALASCDWATLKDRLGVSCAYLQDAARRPSGLEMFRRLAARAPAARFHVFQGTQDRNTPVEPVRALEAWNASSGHLSIAFHYYVGRHAGTDAAKTELSQLLTAIVSTQ